MAAGEDRISGLPDELLSTILLGLRSARAAACTGVLSRRWRHVWTPLPELFLFEGPHHDAAFPDTIDATLAAFGPPALKGLTIALSDSRGVPAKRVAPWLRFASERVVGPLFLLLPRPEQIYGEEEEEAAAAVLDLPACEEVTKIEISLSGAWRVRPPLTGLFRALTDLTIVCDYMDGSELTALVCSQCPRLVHMYLCARLVNAYDVCICSDSLRSLSFSVGRVRRLEIVAPSLEKISVSLSVVEARISAPKLAEVVWSDNTYDPRCHQFVDVGRRLQLLELVQYVPLIQQFDEVDELKLGIYIPEEIAGYERFLNEANKLPKCKILEVTQTLRHHGLVPSMLHLLRSCNSTRKFSLLDYSDRVLRYPCLPSCPCRFEESHRIDGISLNSLEEVEITSYTSSHEVLEFLEQLSRCNATVLKKVVMIYKMNTPPPPTKDVREKIRNMFQPNIEVDFYVLSNWKWVPLD